jgi:hypothetical protein
MKFILLLASFGLMAKADILYDLQVTLSLESGTDALGLNGAALNIQVEVSPSAVYGSQQGLTAVTMDNDATVTISGASNPANDGTFDLPQLSFYPHYEGSYGAFFSAGNFPSVTLPVGGTLNFQIIDNATTTGESEGSGNTVQLADFGPATSADQVFFDNGNAIYKQVDPVISVSLTPEPGTLGLLAAGMAAFGLVALWRSR